MKRLIVDMDDTVSFTENGKYESARPNTELIEKLKGYQDSGFEIVIFSSRNMRTYDKNLGKINIHTLPIMLKWLNEFKVPFDEIFVGKPWCGFEGFYIDDKAIRPSEFIKYTYEEIKELLSKEKML